MKKLFVVFEMKSDLINGEYRDILHESISNEYDSLEEAEAFVSEMIVAYPKSAYFIIPKYVSL